MDINLTVELWGIPINFIGQLTPESSITDWLPLGTIFISLLALAFGLYNFWWGNWRKGKLITSDPLIYSLTAHEYNLENSKEVFSRITIQFPLVILNTGGTTRFIQDIKLIIKQNEKESNEIYFDHIYLSMDMKDGTKAQQFAIEGHKAYSACFHFYRRMTNLILSPGSCKVIIKAKIDNDDWKTLHEFDFIIKDGQNLGAFNPNYVDDRGP